MNTGQEIEAVRGRAEAAYRELKAEVKPDLPPAAPEEVAP
jgi:hypothetical protein